MMNKTYLKNIQFNKLYVQPEHNMVDHEIKSFKMKGGFVLERRSSFLNSSCRSKFLKEIHQLKQKIKKSYKPDGSHLNDLSVVNDIKNLQIYRTYINYNFQFSHKISHKMTTLFNKIGIQSFNQWAHTKKKIAWRDYIKMKLRLQEQIQNYRHQSRIAQDHKFGVFKDIPYDFVYFRGSRIHTKPGDIMSLHIKRKTKNLYTEKKPQEKIKYIGVEIEFCAPISKNDLALKLVDEKLDKMMHLKSDGSLRPHVGEEAFEVALLLPEKDFRPHLKQVCDLLKSIKAEATNRRCGLHVHFDMRSRKKELVYNNLVACQNVLLDVIPHYRRNNEFCRSVQKRAFPKVFNGSREERYKTINAASYYRHRTLEVRMHEGSVDFHQIINWLTLLLKIVNYRKKIKGKIQTIRGLKRKIKLTSSLEEYMFDRKNTFIINREMSENLQSDQLRIREPSPERDDYRAISQVMTARTRPLTVDGIRTAVDEAMASTPETSSEWYTTGDRITENTNFTVTATSAGNALGSYRYSLSMSEEGVTEDV